MSAHRIATAIEEEAAAFCRRRFTDQAEYLEAKDSHCKRVQRLVRDLRRAIGTPEMLSLGTGYRHLDGRRVEVVSRMSKRA